MQTVANIGRLAALSAGALLATRVSALCAGADEVVVKPFSVIDRALERWRERPRPQQLSFVVDFNGRSKDREFRRRFRVDDSVAEHTTRVTMLASDGPAPPFVHPEKLRLLPTETFGFVPPDAAVPLPVPVATNLPVIAAVHATVRYPYEVRLVGVEVIDQRATYHLQLTPRQSADTYPLREMWVDAATYDVRQVVAQQFEHIGPIAIPYRVSARYAAVGPYWLMVFAEAGATIHAGLFSYGSDAHADFEDFHYAP